MVERSSIELFSTALFSILIVTLLKDTICVKNNIFIHEICASHKLICETQEMRISMDDTIAYKCPCCGASLVWGSKEQELVCEYCDNKFTEAQLKEIADEENTKDLDFERKHKEDLQRIRGFRLLDDDFMSKVFEDKDCTEFLLQIILNRTDLKVLRVHGQYDIRNLQGRSVRLDILAVDTEERVYNIEIQRSDKGAVVKRARYNSSLIDVNITEPGEKYENLCESYIIFITENDIMKAGLPIYHVDRIVKETGELFGDESHIIYVNSQIKDESALGKLMHDFSCTDAKDMNYKILADRVRYFKEDEKGVATMCRVMEEMRNETARETEHAKAIKVAKGMLQSGKLSYEEIAEIAELSIDEVKALDEKVIA